MKRFIVTRHFIERFQEQANLPKGYSLKKQQFVTMLYAMKIGYESNQPFIKFEQGILWLEEVEKNTYVLKTFVGISRMSDCGKTRRAYKAA